MYLIHFPNKFQPQIIHIPPPIEFYCSMFCPVGFQQLRLNTGVQLTMNVANMQLSIQILQLFEQRRHCKRHTWCGVNQFFPCILATMCSFYHGSFGQTVARFESIITYLEHSWLVVQLYSIAMAEIHHGRM